MQVNAVSFGYHAKHAKESSKTKKAVFGTVLTAAVLGGAYAIGKKNIDPEKFVNERAVSKTVKTIIEGFKNVPKFAGEFFKKSKSEVLEVKPDEVLENATNVVENAVK